MTKLKEMRIRKKMLLRDVADIVKTTPQTVQQMERRGICKSTTARRYALALKCNWLDLIEDPDKEPSK